MGLEASGQAQWGGGIYRGRSAPTDSVYDAVNALVDDEGNLFRRGGSALKSNADAETIDFLADVFVAAGRRTIFSAEAGHLWALGGDDATPVQLGGGCRALARGAAVGGRVFLPAAPTDGAAARMYGGSLKASGYATGTVTVTNGSRTVTGSGTSWLANADAGMLFGTSAGSGVVQSVDSDTQITLFSPWTAATASGQAYALNVLLLLNPSAVSDYGLTSGVYLATVGTGGRLIIATKQRAFISAIGDPLLFTADSYLEVPADVEIIGVDAFQDTAQLFTTRGMWQLSNLDFDAVDDVGNVQWQQAQVNKDVILWGDAGLASYAGGLVVPAIDDVFMVAPDGTQAAVSASVRPLYRSYVRAGYQPGLATVHRGHYFLPILNGATRVDTLLCRLDREGTPWTRWDGHAASAVYAQRVGAAVRSPRLFGAVAARVTDLTDCLSPSASNAADADGSAHACTVITRDYPTSGSNHPGTVARARLRYELADDGNAGTAAPALALAWSADSEAGVFTTLTVSGVETSSAVAGGVSDGSAYSWFAVGKRRERVRFRVSVTGAAASFVLRTLELLVRQSGLR